EAQDPRLRMAALDGLARRGDAVDPAGAVDAARTLADATVLLDATPWPLQAAAIDALRLLHRKEAIEPLIAFLGKDGIGRLREDAHRALKSLTGEAHGPYRQPWQDWWADAK